MQSVEIDVLENVYELYHVFIILIIISGMLRMFLMLINIHRFQRIIIKPFHIKTKSLPSPHKSFSFRFGYFTSNMHTNHPKLLWIFTYSYAYICLFIYLFINF